MTMQCGRRPLLLIAHPGHELRLFGWMRRYHPLVAILTDGSGSTGRSRIELSERLIADNGGDIVMRGRFAEPDLYSHILRGEHAAFADVVLEIAAIMRDEGSRSILSDGTEGYHPGHDLCAPLAAHASRLCRPQQTVHCFEYPVVGDPHRSSAQSRTLVLDAATLRDKIAAARRYAAASGDVLQQEVETMFDTYGEDAFRFESFHPAGSEQPALEDGMRHYEKRGEERVREGRYREVLRHHAHIVPIEAALAATMQ